MSVKTHPEEVLKALLEGASTRTERSLRLINKICMEQAERGSTDFRYITIGRLSEQEGGPGDGAIRNKSGERYRTLITAWKSSKSGSLSKAQPRLKEEDWIDEIDQLDIRWLVRDAIHELKALKRENDLLKSEIVLNVDLRESAHTRINQDKSLTSTNTLTESELGALKYAISEKHFKEMLWTKEKLGKVVDENSNQVFKPGFVTAIKKMLTLKE